MTIDSTSSAPSFSVAFWQPYVPAAAAGHAAAAMDTTGTPALSYSAESHGTHADFCRSEHFVRYQEQVRANLSFLVEFCRRHHLTDANKIEENFNRFFNNRFGDDHYFDTRAEMVDAIGKRSLDEFCSMIRNEAIDEGKRKFAIRDLSYGVILCADGAISNLVSAACTLAKSAGGIRGKLWELKEATAGNVLRQLMDQRFGYVYRYPGNEIHYVNTAWNRLADQFGLQKAPDGIRIAEVDEDAKFMAACAARIRAALTPDRLALLIAEACQARFNSKMAPDAASTLGVWNAGIEKNCWQVLEDIGNDFGLTSTDALAFEDDGASTTLRASDLRMKSFLELKENDTHVAEVEVEVEVETEAETGVEVEVEAEAEAEVEAKVEAEAGTRDAEAGDRTGAYTYALRTDPALIALDVLRAMDSLQLLQDQASPQNRGEWIDENKMRAALFVYGELAWMVRTPQGRTFGQPIWNSQNVEFEPITLLDLFQWTTLHANDGQLPPAPALRQAIQVTPAESLAQMPARWLANAEDLQRLLQRLGRDKAAEYLATHLPAIVATGARYSHQERQEVLAHILRMGLGNAVRALAEHWVPDELAFKDLIYAVLLREAVPALHQAMLAEDPKAAVQAWYHPLRESGLLTLIAPGVAQLLATRYLGSPILSHVLSQGRATAVEAFYALLKDVLRSTTARWYIKDDLPDLLAAEDSYYIPALSHAMAEGHTGAVQAFYTGLKDLLTDPSLALTVRPVLLRQLSDLLVGKKGDRDSGLAFAVDHGNTAIIVAFHAMLKALLNDPEIAPQIRQALPDLLAAKFRRGASAVSEAMRHGRTEAIEAFYAMLTDPDILPHIQDAIPDLLNAMDSRGKTGLSNALEHGHAANIVVYHLLLTKLLNVPAVAPHIQHMMPHLVTDKNRDGTLGYGLALEKGHIAAAAAFQALIHDSAIAPYTGEGSSHAPLAREKQDRRWKPMVSRAD